MIVNNKTTVKWSQAPRAGLLMSTAIAGVLMASDAAQAACTPAAANNVTATCTGATNFGYGSTAIAGITVNVVPGASVTGAASGITFSDGTVFNSGTIRATVSVISSNGNAVVTNLGLIEATLVGGYAIDAFGDIILSNSGTIKGHVSGYNATLLNSGIIAGSVTIKSGNLFNSGSIAAGNDMGIWANTGSVVITNIGSISGGNGGIRAHTLTLNNSGTIHGAGGYGAVSVAYAASMINAGTIIGNIFFNTLGTESDSLTILPGARFDGLVNFGGGADRVTFGPGSWILNTANFDAGLLTVTTGGNPYVVTPTQIVVADLSGFGAMNRAMMDITGWIASVLPETPVFEPSANGGIANAFAAIEAAAPRHDYAFDSTSTAMAYAPVFKSGTVRDRDGNSVWAKGLAAGATRPPMGPSSAASPSAMAAQSATTAN